MNCPTCHGTGRLVCKAHLMVGGELQTFDMIEGLCGTCQGQRVIHCCEGDREQSLVAVGELVDGTAVEVNFEVNPNEL
jgi:hypothetical protein